MPRKKRKRYYEDKGERPTIHPRNKYSVNPPDFALLASLYPSFSPFVFYTRDGRPRIDWTDFNATRELTRVLLLHDHGLNWWIPDGQLCPTVPNRSNYIHWLEDLISSDIVVNTVSNGGRVRGFDIGTGANCIYPLLGASLLGWSFVGTDVTDVALEWAQRNVNNNPHISELIEIRKVKTNEDIITSLAESQDGDTVVGGIKMNLNGNSNVEEMPSTFVPMDLAELKNKCYHGPPILLGVVRDDEQFDFCMCNPPFFESIEEAGLNPRTSCGGTPDEMVCPGGEKAFITQMIEDSARLKHSSRWFTSMVGRKSNLKPLMSKLRDVGVTVVKTTEFVQGQTCRWGLAWSFSQPVRKMSSTSGPDKNKMSFMLEGIQRQYSAFHVLQAVESYFCNSGASAKLNASSFVVEVTATKDHCTTILENDVQDLGKCTSSETVSEASIFSTDSHCPLTKLCFRISVFQQIPGTLLVKGSLQDRDNALSGAFLSVFPKLEEDLRQKFCIGKKSPEF